MTTDTRTTSQNYPKPYPSNLLGEDVVRLREALDAIDTDMAARPLTAAVQGLVDAAVAALVDGAPGALDTLNELAAALGDSSNFSTTVTTALAARLELAGGTMTGDLTLNSNPTDPLHAATKLYTDTAVGSAAQTTGSTFSGDVVMQESLKIERVKEHVAYATAGITGVQPFNVIGYGAVLYYAGNSGGNYGVNITGDGTTTLDTLMAVGESMTVVLLATQGSTPYYLNTVQIDGTTSNRTLKYVGGAPTSGTANTICANTFTVIKTASGTFTVLASIAEFE